MDIRRFGIGHRRQEGPSGSRGVSGQAIHGDERGVISELALRPHGAVEPHTNPHLAYLLVIEGGGFVQVGEEVGRVAAGEAVVWPPNVVHAAWTELTPMRAIVVEFATAAVDSRRLEGHAVERLMGPIVAESERAEGGLAPKPVPLVPPPDRESPDKEPW